MLSLSGDSKMSKRISSSSITLEDSPAAAARKVLTAFTGGRATVEEQKRLGGEPDKCPVYDLYRFHFALSDEHSKRVYDECVKGVRMCGDCKAEAASLVKAFLEEHQKKRKALEKDAQELIVKSRASLSSSGR